MWNSSLGLERSQPLVPSPICVFSVFRDAGACGVAKAIYEQLSFSHFFYLRFYVEAFFPLGSVPLILIIIITIIMISMLLPNVTY